MHIPSYPIASCGAGWSQMEHTWMRFASSSTREQSVASACDAQAKAAAKSSSARSAALSSDYLWESSRIMQNHLQLFINIYQYILIYYELLWYIMIYDILWYYDIMIYYDISWYNMI